MIEKIAELDLRVDVGYLNDFIYPELFGYDPKKDEIRYFSDS